MAEKPLPQTPKQAANYLTGVMQDNHDLMVKMLANGDTLLELLEEILKIMRIETNGHS